MCRSIKRLRSIDGVATEEEIRAAARQFVRKVSGMQQPAPKNADAFEAAIDVITSASRDLLGTLPPSKAAVPVPRLRTR